MVYAVASETSLPLFTYNIMDPGQNDRQFCTNMSQLPQEAILFFDDISWPFPPALSEAAILSCLDGTIASIQTRRILIAASNDLDLLSKLPSSFQREGRLADVIPFPPMSPQEVEELFTHKYGYGLAPIAKEFGKLADIFPVIHATLESFLDGRPAHQALVDVKNYYKRRFPAALHRSCWQRDYLTLLLWYPRYLSAYTSPASEIDDV
jgi:hypothetical protein